MHISEKNKEEIRVVLHRMYELIKKKVSGVNGYEGMTIDIEHSKNVQQLNIGSEAKKYLRNKYYAEVSYELSVHNAAEKRINDQDFLYVAPIHEEIIPPVVFDPKEIEAELVRKILARNRQLAAYKKYKSYTNKSKSKSKTTSKNKKSFKSVITPKSTGFIPPTITFEELSKIDTKRIYVPNDLNPRSGALLIMAKINKLKTKRTSLVQSIAEFKQPSLLDMLDTDYTSYRKSTEVYFEKFNSIASQVSAIEKELAELHSWLDAPYTISSIEQLISQLKTA